MKTMSRQFSSRVSAAVRLSLASLLLGLGAESSSAAGDTAFNSLAFTPDTRSGAAVTLPDHPSLNWSRVLFRPERTNQFPEELKPTQTLQTPAGQITGLAVAGDTLWVGSLATRRIYRIQAETGAIQSDFTTPGQGPAGLCWDGKVLWHADRSEKALFALDEKGNVRHRFALSFEPSVVLGRPGELLVSAWDKAEFHRLDPESGVILGSEPAPDDHLTGLTSAGRYLWCSRGEEILCVDREHGLPVCGFSGALAEGGIQTVSGLTADGGSFWYANSASNQLVRIPIPKHGEWVGGGGRVRQTGFEMVYRNTSTQAVEAFSVLQHVPFLEMPGQRYLALRLHPETETFFRDDLGNVVALLEFGRLPAGQSVRCQIAATMWVADRRMVVDPAQVGKDALSDARHAYLKRFHPIPGEVDEEVKKFVTEAVGNEPNAYWRVRKAHDALCRDIYYREPADESVPGVLRQGYGVCRNYSAVMESFGRLLGVPVLNAWAPRHETCFLMLPGLSPTVMEVTANDSGPDPATAWRRSRWFLGTSAAEITTGVRGYAMHNALLLDGVSYNYRWHYWLPIAVQGVRHEGWWTITDPQTGQSSRL